MTHAQFFEITNKTGCDIRFVYISCRSDSAGGADWWFGDDVFADGVTRVFDVSNQPWEEELFNIEIEDVNGNIRSFSGMDADDSRSDESGNAFTVSPVDPGAPWGSGVAETD
jgi:hypothetical protein